ncbi:hypothetical protein BS78_K013400 [Paspalum vaginatum]|uniref:Rx N-terminal domain-containing protein n=1 Tax=Paspalum vaginatum TaxID=158149 RepID=A0A9W7XD74_9POAL|nr:hypothetical protein BS78_K013400 [Paspalum vaginatum]
MLVQLKMLVDGMYKGYYQLDTFKYRRELDELIKGDESQESSSTSSSMLFSSLVKRMRKTNSTACSMLDVRDLDSVLENVETAVTNMKEFVILLMGCQHIQRGPYDTYLYIDSFMFGRSYTDRIVGPILLLQDISYDPPLSAPAVLPIIGGCYVGKKTLVGHACRDKRVLSHFSSILHMNADDVQRNGPELFTRTRTLAIVEFISDVDDDCWARFYSSSTCMGRGSKVVIISRLESVARFGTMTPIRLNSLPHEYTYLFKVLAFGSTNQDEHPHLACIGMEIARMLRGLLSSANVIADMLRKNLSVQYWLHIFARFRNVIESNLCECEFGEHPKHLVDKGHPVDVTRFAPSSVHSSLRPMPTRVESSTTVQIERSEATFGDLIAGSSRATVLPKEFEIVIWRSRVPPYTTFVATCVEEKTQISSSSSKKRRGFHM